MNVNWSFAVGLLLFSLWSLFCIHLGRGLIAGEVRAVKVEVERVNTTLTQWICIPPGAWRADSVRDKWRKP